VYREPRAAPLSPILSFLAGAQDNALSSFYAGAEVDFSEKLALSVSARGTRDRRELATMTPAPPGEPREANADVREVVTTGGLPTAKLTYSFSDHLGLFAAYSEGFRAGGFNQPGVAAAAAAAGVVGVADEFRPETSATLELGLR